MQLQRNDLDGNPADWIMYLMRRLRCLLFGHDFREPLQPAQGYRPRTLRCACGEAMIFDPMNY